MIKKISFYFYKLLVILDKIFKTLTRRSVLVWFKDFIQEESYKDIKILNSRIKFFIPNQLTEWRVDTFFSKEPETLEWIDKFEKKDDLIFWDIGANIGLYSIYNALKNKGSTTISFEPSTSNLRVLSRNISINSLENDIKIFPIPLTDKKNKFLFMNEGNFMEGGALNSFGENFNFKGEKFISSMSYQIFGTNINHLIESNTLSIPDYIKIDVDGIEHLILDGANKHLKNKKIKSLSVEINEKFTNQYENILNIMNNNEFKILHKKQNKNMLDKNSEFADTYNYIFIR